MMQLFILTQYTPVKLGHLLNYMLGTVYYPSGGDTYEWASCNNAWNTENCCVARDCDPQFKDDKM